MAVVTTKSTSITNAEANVAVNGFLNGAGIRSATEIVAAVSGDSIASIYRMVRVPSNARMTALSLFTTAITTCAGDVGLYRTTGDGGAVVDADFFTAAQTLAAASAGINVIGGNILAPASRNKRLWAALGLTADPGIYYDIAITLTAAAGSAGTVGVEANWVV